MKHLYHVTDKENAMSILSENCLKPMHGKNIEQTNDINAVYLCKREDVPVWMLILGKPVVLKIPVSDISESLTHRNYTGYGEYSYEGDIISGKIEDITKEITKHELKQANTRLCLCYLSFINDICTKYARIYTETLLPEDYKKITILETETLLNIVKNLDYKVILLEELDKKMDSFVDACAYTFADTYCQTGKRLWEQLVFYPKDESYPVRKQLHDFIKENLSGILYMNTGGYTG